MLKHDARKLLHELRGSHVPLTSHEAVVLRIAKDQLEWLGFLSERHMEVLQRVSQRTKRTKGIKGN